MQRNNHFSRHEKRRSLGSRWNSLVTDPRPPAIQCRGILGFTLVELLVVIAIIAMLISMMIPAVQSLRESSRRAQCKNNLLQVVMALQNYEMAHELFPSGVTDPASGPIRSRASGHHHGWVIELLPYLDEGVTYRNINPELSVYADAHASVRAMRIPSLVCPTEPEEYRDGKSNYAACHHDVEAPIDADNHGVFFLNSRIMADDVRDGLSYTIFLGEKKMDPDDLGWMSGTRATLRNTGTPIDVNPWLTGTSETSTIPTGVDPADGAEPEEPGDEGLADSDEESDTQQAQSPTNESDEKESKNAKALRKIVKRAKTELSVGGFTSRHPAGTHVAFGDGRIQFMNSQIAPAVYQQLGHRNDGKLLNSGAYRE